MGVRYPTGDDLPKREANYSGSGPERVGSYAPNGYDLYDMAGNVAEWVMDYYDDDYYARSPKDNPRGPEKGAFCVVRGGGWLGGKMCADVVNRTALKPYWVEVVQDAVGADLGRDHDQAFLPPRLGCRAGFDPRVTEEHWQSWIPADRPGHCVSGKGPGGSSLLGRQLGHLHLGNQVVGFEAAGHPRDHLGAETHGTLELEARQRLGVVSHDEHAAPIEAKVHVHLGVVAHGGDPCLSSPSPLPLQMRRREAHTVHASAVPRANLAPPTGTGLSARLGSAIDMACARV